MRQVLIGLLAVAGLQVTAPQQKLKSPPRIGVGSSAISGVVRDGATGRPVSGAVVTLTPQANQTVGTAARQVTDVSGRFAFTGLEAGDGYFVGALNPGYFSGAFGRRTLNGAAIKIALKEGEWFSECEIFMWRPSSIEGTVTDESGEPVVGVFVQGRILISIAGVDRTASGASAITDDRGRYRLAGLEPGKYFVCVPSVQSVAYSPPPDASAAQVPTSISPESRRFWVEIRDSIFFSVGGFPIPPPPTPTTSLAYPPICFPPPGGVVPEVGLGEERTGLDLSLTPRGAVSVSGRIEPAVSSINAVRLVPESDDLTKLGAEVATTPVRPDGRFEFVQIPAGSYRIDASPMVSEYLFKSDASSGPASLLTSPTDEVVSSNVSIGRAGISLISRAARGTLGWVSSGSRIDVGSTDISDLIVHLERGISFQASIIAESANPRSNLVNPGSIILEPADGDPKLGQFRARSSTGSPNEFAVEGLRPGLYVLRGSGLMIKTVTWNGRDYTDRPFDTSGIDRIDRVQIITTDQVCGIAGFVAMPDGSMARDATVIFFPADRDRWQRYGLQPRRLGSVATTSGGRFEIDRLPAGDYFVIAVPAASSASWHDSVFLDRASRSAQRVSVRWGEVKDVGLVPSLPNGR